MSSDDQGRDANRKPTTDTNTRAQKMPRKRLRIQDILPSYEDGITRGTHVLTADGTLPVDYLEPGDRIVTRAGMRTLRSIDIPAPQMFKLVFDRVEIVYADGVQFDSKTGKAFAA
jgi:hypothetical protein